MKRHERYRTIYSVQRYGEDMPETTLHFDPETRILTIGESREAEDTRAMKEAIREHLAAHDEPLTEPEINAGVEGRNAVKRKGLRELVAEGAIIREGRGGKGNPFRYSIQNACTLVPTIYRGQENKNPENDVTPHEISNNACSHFSAEMDSCPQEKRPTETTVDVSNQIARGGNGKADCDICPASDGCGRMLSPAMCEMRKGAANA